MTITREHRTGPYVVQCDDCMDTEELEGAEVKEAVEDAKERGFTPTHKVDNVWQHSCRPCTRDAQRRAAA